MLQIYTGEFMLACSICCIIFTCLSLFSRLFSAPLFGSRAKPLMAGTPIKLALARCGERVPGVPLKSSLGGEEAADRNGWRGRPPVLLRILCDRENPAAKSAIGHTGCSRREQRRNQWWPSASRCTLRRKTVPLLSSHRVGLPNNTPALVVVREPAPPVARG